MYTFFYRSAPHPGLALFDAPDGTATCTRRIRSNSPLQALTLLNDEAFLEFARALAQARAGTKRPASDPDAHGIRVPARHGPASRASGERTAAALRCVAAGRVQFRPASASLLVVKEQVFDSSPGGTVAAASSIDPKRVPEAGRVDRVSRRVLFNLDDFMTRE